MLVSMTGFGQSQIHTEWGSLSVEISSVNHRYQEISVRVPKELSGLETKIQQKVRRCFHRGKVQVRLEASWFSNVFAAKLDEDILKKYVDQLEKIRDFWDFSEDIRLEPLLQLPGVLVPLQWDDPETMEKIESAVDTLLEEGLSKWLSMRREEGSHLLEDIKAQLADLELCVFRIKEGWLQAKESACERMQKRIKEMLDSLGGTLDENRMAQEVAILSDRWDVTEELDRLESHFLKFRETLNAKESSGRKLDFLVQEMNREVNTLDSKVADISIRWLAVEAKAALERMREQIQNLE